MYTRNSYYTMHTVLIEKIDIFYAPRHLKNGGGALSVTPVRAFVRASVRYQNLVSAQ